MILSEQQKQFTNNETRVCLVRLASSYETNSEFANSAFIPADTMAL